MRGGWHTLGRCTTQSIGWWRLCQNVGLPGLGPNPHSSPGSPLLDIYIFYISSRPIKPWLIFEYLSVFKSTQDSHRPSWVKTSRGCGHFSKVGSTSVPDQNIDLVNQMCEASVFKSFFKRLVSEKFLSCRSAARSPLTTSPRLAWTQTNKIQNLDKKKQNITRIPKKIKNQTVKQQFTHSAKCHIPPQHAPTCSCHAPPDQSSSEILKLFDSNWGLARILPEGDFSGAEHQSGQGQLQDTRLNVSWLRTLAKTNSDNVCILWRKN